MEGQRWSSADAEDDEGGVSTRARATGKDKVGGKDVEGEVRWRRWVYRHG